MAKKVKNEKDTREQLLGWARRFGAETELLKIFNRYDDLLKGAKTEEEKKAIQTFGVAEVHKFFATGSSEEKIEIDGKKY